MELVINYEKILPLGLTPNTYSFLYYCFKKIDYPFPVSDLEFKQLEDNGYIKLTELAIVMRIKTINLFKTETEIEKVIDWVDEYRNLFPTGVKIMGRPVKGDKADIIKKMTDFMKKDKVSKETIIEATKIYIADRKRENYMGLQCADYLISKNGVSTLRLLVEDLSNKQEILDKQQQRQFEDF